MSLILEALKKSEAERRLGQAPDLLTPTPRLRSDDHPRWPLRAAVAVLVLGLGAAGAWWFWPRAGAPLVVADGEVPASTQAGTAAGDATPTSAPTTASREAPPPRPGATTSPERDAGPGTPALTRPAATVPRRTPESAPPAPADPAFASVERESQPVPAGELPPGTTASGGEAPTVRPQPPARPMADAGDDAAIAMPPRAPGGRDAAAPSQPPAADALPSLRDLSPAERGALPPLQQSMHVYNDDPARRFVIIDGRRHGEGARIDERLLLVEIRRDGVVLELDGRRFLLPRPG